VSISFKLISKFRSDDHQAVLARIAELNAKGKALRAKRDSINKSIANDESSDPNLKTRLSDLISGRSPTPPTPWDVQLHAVKVEIRDNDDDLDFLAGKAKAFEIEAEKKMLEDARPQIVAAEKAQWDAFVLLYETFVPVWQAKRALHGSSIRTYDLFAASFDNILGVPSDINSVWCELFREGIAAKHVSRMPSALAPKK
jgi:hypothetical protein